MSQIEFKRCSAPGYASRTRENAAGADLTLAVYATFATAGERLTRECALELGKLETDRWNDEVESYEDCKKRVENKFYRVRIDRQRMGLEFMDGPTGHESFRLDSIVRHDAETLCINAGTINTWPCVTVPWRDIQRLVLEVLCKPATS